MDTERNQVPPLCELCYGPVDLNHPRTYVKWTEEEGSRYACGCHIPKEIRDMQDSLWGFVQSAREPKPSLLQRLFPRLF